jgi:carboxyl-terminal processing protease
MQFMDDHAATQPKSIRPARKSTLFYLTAAVVVGGFALISDHVQAGGEKFYSDLIRLDKVVTKINENYVEDVSSEELVDAAISGIRNILDPHTAYFSPKDYEDLKVSTEGEFGGLGIQIGIRDQILTVVSPLAGTPAHRMGMRAGDKVIKIDSTSTQGITIDDAVEKLRGKAGTPVKLTILREGLLEPLEFNITREVIKIESVPYAGMLNDSVGYIKITQFAKRTGADLEARINELKKRNMKALVLDLRVNPGGLLNQAIEVSEQFLEKGEMVVFTKGRVKGQNQEYHSGRTPIWGRKLVVMVNENSASASEIVAGAIQDWDRGLVIGTTSYGKGSVQTILQLDGQKNTLKLTTAYYYTPSGRCINKPENAVRFKARQNDSTKDTVEYATHAGRKVVGGGGITPDVTVEGTKLSRFGQDLLRKTMFFNFIIKKRAEIEKLGKVTPEFRLDASLVDAFRSFVYADSTFLNYKSNGLLALDAFREALGKEGKEVGEDRDTMPTKLGQDVERDLTALQATLKGQTGKEFDRNLDFIKTQLKAELLGAVLGEETRTAFELQNDVQMAEALRYIGDNRLYSKAFKKPKEK